MRDGRAGFDAREQVPIHVRAARPMHRTGFDDRVLYAARKATTSIGNPSLKLNRDPLGSPVH
jgi:hypothetical protein